MIVDTKEATPRGAAELDMMDMDRESVSLIYIVEVSKCFPIFTFSKIPIRYIGVIRRNS